ncbi:Hypothetical predicted protein [Marmota monax]|uniref:Uncharacterized protein n=1 Tax=Marmota monax TaxID=9995 RepID=A0A5E4AZ63_MARMO|nr:Hypothetical predicted protein [Marmota monax]
MSRRGSLGSHLPKVLPWTGACAKDEAAKDAEATVPERRCSGTVWTMEVFLEAGRPHSSEGKGELTD